MRYRSVPRQIPLMASFISLASRGEPTQPNYSQTYAPLWQVRGSAVALSNTRRSGQPKVCFGIIWFFPYKEGNNRRARQPASFQIRCESNRRNVEFDEANCCRTRIKPLRCTQGPIAIKLPRRYSRPCALPLLPSPRHLRIIHIETRLSTRHVFYPMDAGT